MNDARDPIERVLTGLRVVEPPTGIEHRILHAMEARNNVPSAPSWAWRTAVTVCALVIAIIWFVTITVRRHGTVLHQPTVSVAPRQTMRPAQAPPMPRRVRSVRRTPPVPTRALSFPAPPLPLTEQEKLLLRLAHKRDVNNMAVLNPEVQAAQTAKATTQFQQFFGIDPKEMRSEIE